MKCLDCQAENPTFMSVNNAIFLCENCSKIHKRLGDNISKIKYTDLKNVTQDALLSKVRYKLRHEYGFNNSSKMGIKCVFIDQQAVYPKSVNNDDELNLIRPYFDNNNITFGAFMPATASVGLTISQNIITGILNS